MNVEDIAKIIDPEAWDLPDNTEPGTITDRDIARDRARIIFSELAEPRARCEAYKGQVEAGEKEIERLRAALQEIADMEVVEFGVDCNKHQREVAERALNQQQAQQDNTNG